MRAPLWSAAHRPGRDENRPIWTTIARRLVYRPPSAIVARVNILDRAPKTGVHDCSRPGFPIRLVGWRPSAVGRSPGSAKIVSSLLYFNSRARVFELFLDFRRLLLVHALFNRLGRGFDKI